MCAQHTFEYNERREAVGDILQFKRPVPPEEPELKVLETTQAIKQVASMFTKEELAEIKEDLKRIDLEEQKPK